MFKTHHLLALVSVVVIAIGQIIFKYVSKNLVINSNIPSVGFVRDNISVLGLLALAIFLYLLSTLAWIAALRVLPLSVAFMFNALAFIIVPIGALLVFGEQLPRYFWPAVLLIFGGVQLAALG
jgi:drug/metabolite transporter (DMT)-like permease